MGLLFGLFASAFLSATLLPGSSEAALVALLAGTALPPWWLVAAATAGNVLGSVVNYGIGRGVERFRDRSWFPVAPRRYEQAVGWYRRFGRWSLLCSWVPVVGDPLTLVAGALREDWRVFLVLVTLGKAARYGAIAGAFAAL
ncbi:DedA family protein [Pseudoroseomonas oryzae]|uniref:DedA family protein n=2 Tax=Teichococcus oryzae TaxID=1608942 RepID=A0A5B2TH30_9PROT|nr:DedA family protein [Pseudoroseomonas oryzae]